MSVKNKILSIPKYDRLRYVYAFAEILIGFFGNSLAVMALAVYELSVIFSGFSYADRRRRKLICGGLILIAGLACAAAAYTELLRAYGYAEDRVSVWVIPVMAIGVLLSKLFFVLDAADNYKFDKTDPVKRAIYSKEKLDIAAHALVTVAVFLTVTSDLTAELCAAFTISAVGVYKSASRLLQFIKRKKIRHA